MSRPLLVSPRQSRLALALFVAAALGVVGWGVAASGANSQLQRDIEEKTQLLESLKRRALPSPDGKAMAARPATPLAAISASTETVAASTLQKRVLDRLEAAGATVHTIQAEVGRDAVVEGMGRLSAQVTFDATIVALQRLLFDVETDIPFMFVDSLITDPSTAAAPGTRPGDRLRVTLVISAFWKNGEPGEGRR